MSASCSASAPHTKCDSRRAAQSRGEFFYSTHHRGWVLGEDRMVPKVLRDERKAPFTWSWWPWCGHELPSEASAIRRVLEQTERSPVESSPQADGEEGG